MVAHHAELPPDWEVSMLDLVYIAGSIVFFAIMLLYVRGCAVLGRRGDADGEQQP
jgi:hypothetical protein